MTRKFIHAVVPEGVTIAQVHAITNLLEGRALKFPDHGVLQIPEVTVTEYILYPGDRLEPVLTEELHEHNHAHVMQMFARLNATKTTSVAVSRVVIGCRVVRSHKDTN